MHENYKGFEIHQARIAPTDRVFVLSPERPACPEHDAPHFVSAAAARSWIDAGQADPGARDRNRGVVSASCSHPAEMQQPRLPSGTRCGACDETFSD